MKIYKVAQGVPVGHVKVKVTIKGDGGFDARVVEHGPNTGCKLEDDSALIHDLLEIAVAGFADSAGEITDSGHTREYFEGIKQRPETPQDAPFAGMPQMPQGEEMTPDTGIGV